MPVPTEKELLELIAGGENLRVEFKLSPPRPSDLAQRICGMANAQGGYIIIGVEDSTLELKGVTDPGAATDILIRASRLVEPPLALLPSEPQIYTINGKKLVVGTVPKSPGPIYQAGGVHWIRRGTNTIPLTTEQLFEMGYDRGIIVWERQPVPGATLDDLEMSQVESYLSRRPLRRRQSARFSQLEEVLVGMGCAAQTPEGIKPTNAGILFFGTDPQEFIPQSEIVCVVYRDEVGAGRYADRRIITGNLKELIDDTEAFLNLYVPVPAEVVGWKRQDYPVYSIESLREAVVNAVVHRDYGKIGESVRVFCYSNRIEIHNPGQLLPGITVEAMERGEVVSKPRNQVLANLLRDLPGYMERIGSGIRFMLHEAARLDLPKPIFTEQYEFTVTFYRNDAPPYFASAPEKAIETSPQPGNNFEEEPVAGVPLHFERRRAMAVKYVQRHGFITSREYREVTGVSAITALRDLEALVKEGALKKMGNTRATRYRLP